MSYLGDFKPSVGAASLGVHAMFTSIKACGVPVSLVSGAARTIKNGLASGLHATGVTLTAGAGSITGLNKVVVLTSAAMYVTGNYDIILSTGSVNGINVRGYLIGTFSIKSRAGTTATGVWAVTARTLSSGGVVWTAGTRTLTSGGAASTSVWAATTRTLTSGSTVASSVWAAATRTLTSGGAASTSVWAATTRTLTSGANAASSVWAYTAGAGRQLTSTGNTALWAVSSRLLTSGLAVANSVWAGTTRTLTSGSIVWSAATRTLTSGGAPATSVWAATTRTLTSGGAASTSVWAATTRTLTSGGVVWDASLTELAAVPAAAPTPDAAIMWMYQGLRNTRITTSGSDKIHTSATGVAGTAVVSFVTGTNTFTKGKYA